MPETTLGALYNGERQLSWRRFGGVKTFTDRPGLTVSDAFKEMELDFEVVTTPTYINHEGTEIRVPGRNAIVRASGTPHIYGTTGTDYRPLQNTEIAKLLDPLTEKWQLDSVVSQHDGRDLVLAFKTEAVEINGEPLQEYFWGQSSHDGLRAVRFLLMPVRLFCTNQLVTGLKRASFRAQISHSQSVQNEAAFQLSVFQFMTDARKQLHQSFEQMGEVKLNQEQIDELILRVYPDPRMPKRVELLHIMAAATAQADGTLDESFRETLDPDQLEATDEAYLNYESQMEMVQVVRKDAKILLEKFNDEHAGHNGKLANSGWAVYNSIVELADYRGSAKYAESAAVSALMGPRSQEKERAFNGVMALVNPGWSAQTTIAGLSSGGAAVKAAKAASRAEALRIRAERAEQRAVERYEQRVAEGKVKPRYAADGVTILPPLTAEEREAEKIAKENEALEKLEASITKRKAEQAARLKAQEDRLAARKADAQARAQARAEALKERAGIINAQPIASALTPDNDDEAPGLAEDSEPVGAGRKAR